MPKSLSLLSPLGRACESAFAAALASPELGYKIRTNNAYRARMRFYAFRHENPDEEYDNIEIRLSADKPDTELWLRKINRSEIET